MATVLDHQTPRRPPVTPVGDVPAATARGQSAASRLAGPPGLPSPPDFLASSNGNVQANTPSAQWKSAPGAQRTFMPKPGPIGSAADRLSQAPNWQTSPGAGAGPGAIDPPVGTRATVVPPSPTAGATLSSPPPAEDITGQFAQRTAAARAGVDAGGTPRALTPGQTAAVNENLKVATAPAAAPAAGPSAAANAASEAEAVAGQAGRASRVLGAAGKGVGYLGAAAEGLGAANELAGGQYAQGGIHGSQAALDAAAVGAPSPWTIGAALTGHLTQAALDTGPGQALTQGIANLLPGSGKRYAEASLASMEADKRDREARGLPIAPSYTKAHAKVEQTLANDFNGDSPNPGDITLSDLVTGRYHHGSGGSAPSAAPASVQLITPDTNGPIAPPDASGHQTTGAEAAMASTAPGTAVFNGKVLSDDQIKQAGARLNSVPATAFTDSTVGGPTLSSEQAISQRMADLRGSRAANVLSTVGGDTGDSGRQAQVGDMMGKITDALRNGKKATARLLIEQLSTYGQISGADADRVQRGQQPPKSAAELAQQDAAAQISQAEATQQQVAARQAKQLESIQQQLAVETDPAKRKSLTQDLLALSGKGTGNAADKLMTLEIPTGSGVNAQTLHLPYDPTTNQLLVPNGYSELLQGLQGSQPQAKK